ncbi:MAG: cyclic nucleotide-binding domain-containing protein [Deltaproteobacteria bacterium]|nr:cyclic nucleotide-binding domain-containing protein [Deltaproteobacteria bacterium]MBW2019898.1 cyclic nucleotide-binding domain-containing protein [Deltaproteobacteria bacterium]MBW2074954.1 cyclic nucleotide-binding domain-containing protein [Deltaproteobacteria bacterium]RLB82423.1 MAG: cyclic nucleotide-binding domain-containing protein [Deltaproteobacteria bacterium]
MDKRSIIAKLRKIELFQCIKDDDERLAKLAGIVSVRHCKAGHRVITEGEEGSEFYILNKGTVGILKRTLDNDVFTIDTLTDKEDVFFGELALMDEELRSASVAADTDCEFLVINRDDFNRLGEEDPLLGLLVTRAIGRALSKRLRKTNEDLIILFEALVGEVAEGGNLEEPAE